MWQNFKFNIHGKFLVLYGQEEIIYWKNLCILGGRMPKKKIEKEASKKHPMENNEALSTQKFQEITKAEKIK